MPAVNEALFQSNAHPEFGGPLCFALSIGLKMLTLYLKSLKSYSGGRLGPMLQLQVVYLVRNNHSLQCAFLLSNARIIRVVPLQHPSDHSFYLSLLQHKGFPIQDLWGHLAAGSIHGSTLAVGLWRARVSRLSNSFFAVERKNSAFHFLGSVPKDLHPTHPHSLPYLKCPCIGKSIQSFNPDKIYMRASVPLSQLCNCGRPIQLDMRACTLTFDIALYMHDIFVAMRHIQKHVCHLRWSRRFNIP